MTIFEPITLRRRVGRHVAPKPGKHTTVPVPARAPVSGYRTPAWDIFEPETVTWGRDWLTADELKGAA